MSLLNLNFYLPWQVCSHCRWKLESDAWQQDHPRCSAVMYNVNYDDMNVCNDVCCPPKKLWRFFSHLCWAILWMWWGVWSDQGVTPLFFGRLNKDIKSELETNDKRKVSLKKFRKFPFHLSIFVRKKMPEKNGIKVAFTLPQKSYNRDHTLQKYLW